MSEYIIVMSSYEDRQGRTIYTDVAVLRMKFEVEDRERDPDTGKTTITKKRIRVRPENAFRTIRFAHRSWPEGQDIALRFSPKHKSYSLEYSPLDGVGEWKETGMTRTWVRDALLERTKDATFTDDLLRRLDVVPA